MNTVLYALSVAFGIASAGFAVLALVEGYRAVRIGGSRLLFNGLDWFVMSDRVPVEARPHMRRALARWGLAMLCLVLGGDRGRGLAMSARDLLAAARRLDAAGFMPSKSGNLSLRDGDGFLITPAALPYADTTEADLVRVAADGSATGRHRPSSEWQLHAAIYAARPDAKAVVHTHSPRASALSCARTGIPPFHYMVLLAGGDVRCAAHATFGTVALANNAVCALAGRRAVLLANHGVVAVGGTLAAAFTLAVEVENLAGQYLDLLAAGFQPVLLSDRELAEAAAQFAAYGRGS